MTERVDHVHLREVLTEHFDEGELRQLCFDLSVDYDILSGSNKAEKVTALVSYMQRRNRVDELANYVREKRKHVQLKTIDTTLSPLNDQKWQIGLEKYYESLKHRVGFVRILGRNNAEPLENVFTHVNLLDRPTAEQRYDIKKLIEEYSPRDQRRFGHMNRIAGDVAVDEYSKLFILGKPGAGKTTFLKHTALRAIMGGLKNVPVFVTLKELSDSGKELLPFIVHQFEMHQFPQARPFVEWILNNGDAIVLFDGLDEVNLEDNRRANLIQAINNFVFRYSNCPVLITCRVAATDYSFEQFKYAEMADFDDEQIGTYIHHWFDNDVVKRENCRKALLEAEENKAVRELAQVPLLLALLCLVYEERNEFPLERHEIYEEAVRALLSKWDASRNISRDVVYKQLSLGRTQKMLATVAAITFEKGEYFLRERDVVSQIESYLVGVPGLDEPDANKVLKAMGAQHGIFVERARNIYSFSHLTLQEYFTALYIVDNERRDSIDLLVQHVGDTRWSEIFLLVAGMLENATEFCELYLKSTHKLVGDDMQLVKLLNWAEQKSKRLALSYRKAAIRAFLIFRALDHDLILALALDYKLTLAFDLDHTLERARALDRGIAHANDLNSIRVRGLAFARKNGLSRASNLAHSLNHRKLAVELEMLKLPDKNVAREKWNAYSERLNVILETHRDKWDIYQKFPIENDEVAEWEKLSERQVNILRCYLEANNLLVQCLEVAYVPDRQAILDRILLPPS